MTLNPADSAMPQPLSEVQPGSLFLIDRVETDDQDSVRLKRMGICPGRCIELMQSGDPLILRVVGCRVGISRRLAACVVVVPHSECPAETKRPAPDIGSEGV